MGDLLQRVLDLDNLRSAWEEVAENKGMPGVDEVSVRRWARNWEERLVNLARDVRGNTYKPAKLRVRRIPKKRPGEWRTLRIPTVTDRVLQRAVYQVLCQIYEPLFLHCSFGYRPGRGLREAVQRIVYWRERGLTWVLDADIDAFFDNVDLALLTERLQERVEDAVVLGLIAGWLALGESRRGMGKGICLGSPLSPLLANIYLHPLDCALVKAGWHPVRYADDFVVLARCYAEAEQAHREVRAILETLKLAYEPHKTRIASFEAGWDFLGVHFEHDSYSYLWQEKTIKVAGERVDWLFSRYGPQYE